MDTIEKNIGGIDFVLSPFGARKGIQILTRLLKLVDLGELDKESFGSGGVDSGMLLDCVAAVQRSITPDLLGDLLDDFEKSCQWKNDTGHLLPLHKVGEVHHADRIFARNYNVWIQWCWWVLEENYSSFFIGINPQKD
jgi:hypothetical protein